MPQTILEDRFRPPLPNHRYPAFLNGRRFEEYFFDFWYRDEDSLKKQRFRYIDLFWLNLHKLSLFDKNKREIEAMVEAECQKADENNQIPFTLCQWDDNIEIQKPSNLIVYSIGTSQDVPLPLIVEDTTNRLLDVERLPFEEKQYLASFLGTFTHKSRKILYNTYKKHKGFYFQTRRFWRNVIPDKLANAFIDITRKSKFGLAPRGYGPSSFRYFEIMLMGVIPVYIHDGDDALPFQDEIDYSKFSISIHIDDIRELAPILQSIDAIKYNEMQRELEMIKHRFSLEESCKYVLRHLEKRYDSQ